MQEVTRSGFFRPAYVVIMLLRKSATTIGNATPKKNLASRSPNLCTTINTARDDNREHDKRDASNASELYREE